MRKLFKFIYEFACALMSACKFIYESARALLGWFWESRGDFVAAQKAFLFDEKRRKRSPLKGGLLPAAGRGLRLKTYAIVMRVSLAMGFAMGAGFVWLLIIVYFAGVQFISPVWATLIIILAIMCIVPLAIYQTDNWDLGYRGEATVAEELDKLGRLQWRIFHSVDTGRGDIDHIIVCPKGVFCVETKTLRKVPGLNESLLFENGEIWRVNKHKNKRKEESDPISQADNNADWLRDFLSGESENAPHISSIIVFPGWWVDRKHYDNDVVPCNEKEIADIFKNREDKLSDRQIKKICAALEEKNRLPV